MGDAAQPACHLSDAFIFCKAKSGFFFFRLYFYCTSNFKAIIISFLDGSDGSFFADLSRITTTVSCLSDRNDNAVLCVASQQGDKTIYLCRKKINKKKVQWHILAGNIVAVVNTLFFSLFI